MDIPFAAAELSPKTARQYPIGHAKRSSTLLGGVSGVDGVGRKTETELFKHAKDAIVCIGAISQVNAWASVAVPIPMM